MCLKRQSSGGMVNFIDLKTRMLYRSLIFLVFMPVLGWSQINKEQFYKAMESKDVSAVTQQRKSVESMASSASRNAYYGAILMKEAQFLSTPKAKLDQFKKGKQLLEAEIKSHSSEAEYRFLRLLIQENCPKMLGYNKEIQADASLIGKSFTSMSAGLQAIVRSYAANSTALKSQGIK